MDSRPVAVVTMRRVNPTPELPRKSSDPSAMTEQTDKRAERLKAALRENLRRRKAQVRGRSGAPDGRPRQEVREEVPEGDPMDPPEGDPA